MNTPNYIVAVEVGSSKIKGALGLIASGGALQVIGIEEQHQNPNCVRYGCVQNPKEVANELSIVIDRLTARLSPVGATISAVYLGVGGRSLKITPTKLSMQLPAQAEITPEIISELLGRAHVTATDTDLLDVEPMNYVVDGKNQGVNPIGVLATNIVANVNLVTCRTQNIRNVQLAVSDKLNLKINGYVVRPMALADLVLSSDEKRLGSMLVDCGAETTTVAIYKGGVLVYLATIPLGGRHITRDLTQLPCTEERAEELKRTVGNANPEDSNRGGGIDQIDSSAVNNIVSARAAEIIANINAQCDYAGLKVSDLASGIIIVGGGSMLKGFAEALARFTTLPVRRGSLPLNIKVSGSKISSGEDLDVISLLYRLSQEADLKPCVMLPKPVEQPKQPEPEPEPEPEEEDFTLEPEPKKGPGFFSNLWNTVKNNMANGGSASYDDDDEDDFTSQNK